MIATLLLVLWPLQAAPSPWLQYADAEQAGFSPTRLAQARELAERADSAALLVVFRGNVLCAWGDVTRRFKCHSVRKSLLSALIGIHAAQGRIDLERSLAELDIDDKDGLSAAEREARVSDLLCARSGVYHPAAKEPVDMSANRPARGSHAPGTHWWYNNWDFNTLLTIYEQQTGARVFEDFAERLAVPLGMQDYRVSDGYYQLEPSKSLHPAYAFRMSARDLARVGELFRRGGDWNGAQVVPADWIAESTRGHSAYAGGGYGYMWWSAQPGDLGTRYPTLDGFAHFAARGTGGQLVLVVPDAELVVVHRGDTDNDRRVDGQAVWAVIEAIAAARVGQPAEDPELIELEPGAEPFANPGPEPTPYTQVHVEPSVFAELSGDYEFAPGQNATLHIFQERLFVRLGEREAELFPSSETAYFARATSLEIEVLRDPAGEVEALRVLLKGNSSRARRLR